MYKIEYIYTRFGHRYLGVSISEDSVEPYLKELQTIIGEDNFAIYLKNQKHRDGGDYHLTILTPQEYREISENIINRYLIKICS